MHAVIDSERRERNKKVEGHKQYQQDSADHAFAQARHSHLVGTVTNLNHQMGNRMETTEFMRKLRIVNPDVVCIKNPLNDKSCLYLQIGDVQTKLFPIETDWMPEWSLMKVTKTRVPTFGVSGFWEERDKPGEEIRRGWRTVLIRLVQERIVTLDKVEREFGVGGRPSWYKLTGKGYAKVEI